MMKIYGLSIGKCVKRIKHHSKNLFCFVIAVLLHKFLWTFRVFLKMIFMEIFWMFGLQWWKWWVFWVFDLGKFFFCVIEQFEIMDWKMWSWEGWKVDSHIWFAACELNLRSRGHTLQNLRDFNDFWVDSVFTKFQVTQISWN